ncbi:type I methionyl aminopeptidase [Amycolatopsis palatopharyngis]|uniref:type I methionyl aminopeptidase n=1 Tax=Amycolatopsis palatopharyngis TaxID=187982 RepID=UPI000E23DD2C|nr:type I methionyl aminopeptidase [Amycolatopsis palatopharyngis]
MIELKTEGEMAAMRAAGQIVAEVLATVRAEATVGTSLLELDEVAAEIIRRAGATSSFLDYHPGGAPCPFPSVLCTSVNDAVVHGIPTGYRLREGDLLSIDFGACLDGWHGDAAVSFVVGAANPRDLDLIAAAERALAAGIAAARPGARLGDIASAVGAAGRAAGYRLLADHGGHGIGRSMHEAPHLPNEGETGRGLLLRPGLVLAIEPMLVGGGQDDYRHGDDGWTIYTADGSRAAHAEHTVAITEDGPWILTSR